MTSVDRRHLLALSGAGALWAMLPVRPAHAVAAPADAARHQLLMRLCDLVVPTTDTPGALAAGVPDWVLLALSHGLDGAHRPAGSGAINAPPATASHRILPRDVLDRLADALDQAASGEFVSLAPDRQHAVLAQLDARAYGGAAPLASADQDWQALKSLILTGYYTSQIGASKELQYLLDPGRWTPDLALPLDNRSWSSDWTAVTFG